MSSIVLDLGKSILRWMMIVLVAVGCACAKQNSTVPATTTQSTSAFSGSPARTTVEDLLVPHPEAGVEWFDTELGFANNAPAAAVCSLTSSETAREDLAAFLTKRLNDEKVTAALKRFDALVQRGDEPYLVSAILSLEGSSGSRFIETLSVPGRVTEGGNSEGSAATTFESGIRTSAERAPFPTLGSTLAHESMHLASQDHSRNEERVATVVGNAVYAEQVATDPTLARQTCRRARLENGWLLTQLNAEAARSLGPASSLAPAPFVDPFLRLFEDQPEASTPIPADGAEWLEIVEAPPIFNFAAVERALVRWDSIVGPLRPDLVEALDLIPAPVHIDSFMVNSQVDAIDVEITLRSSSQG
jgi:hypothetical protein